MEYRKTAKKFFVKVAKSIVISNQVGVQVVATGHVGFNSRNSSKLRLIVPNY